MKVQTQRWIDRWLGQILCGAVSLWARVWSGARAGNGAPIEVRHVLVILLSEMGSIVLAGPMFAALRQRYPAATLHVLQLRKNQEVSLLLGLAQPQHLHALDDSSALRLLRDIWRVGTALRRLPIDAVVDCELFSRISALMSYCSGAPLRAGFTAHTQEGLYRHFRSFKIAYLAHHDDVRVLPHQRAYAAGEVHANGRLNLHLVKRRLDHFDRVFHRAHIDVGCSQVFKR